jgi:hypothetical protein
VNTASGISFILAGGNDVVNLRGTGDNLGLLGGTGYLINNDAAADLVNLLGNTSATINGSGGTIGILGAGITVTATGETVNTVSGNGGCVSARSDVTLIKFGERWRRMRSLSKKARLPASAGSLREVLMRVQTRAAEPLRRKGSKNALFLDHADGPAFRACRSHPTSDGPRPVARNGIGWDTTWLVLPGSKLRDSVGQTRISRHIAVRAPAGES